MYIDDRSSKRIVLIRSLDIKPEPLGRKGIRRGTGRSVNQRFASFDANLESFEQVPAEVRQQLKDTEPQQLKEWFSQRESRRQAALRAQDCDKMLAGMAKMAEWIDAGGGDKLQGEKLEALSRDIWIYWDVIGSWLNRKGQLQKRYKADIEAARDARQKGTFVFNKKENACIQKNSNTDPGEPETAHPECEIASS